MSSGPAEKTPKNSDFLLQLATGLGNLHELLSVCPVRVVSIVVEFACSRFATASQHRRLGECETRGMRKRNRFGTGGKRAYTVPTRLNLSGKVVSTTTMSECDSRHTGPCTLISARMGVLLLLLVASAGLLSAAIESPSYPWFGWITLLPLLLAIRVLRPLQAAAAGALWGISLFLFLASGADPRIAMGVASFALLSTVPAIYAFWAAWLTRRFGSCVLLLGFGWGLVEVALSPLGMNGGLLGGTHGLADGSFVHLLEGVLGYVCMASFIATANGLLLSIMSHACVRVCGTRRLYVRSTADLLRRLFPLEVPHYPFFCSNPAHPRAPPA